MRQNVSRGGIQTDIYRAQPSQEGAAGGVPLKIPSGTMEEGIGKEHLIKCMQCKVRGCGHMPFTELPGYSHAG